MSVTPLFPPSDTRDRLPVWVIVLLGLFLTLRIAELAGDLSAGRSGHLSSLTGQTDEKTMSATITTSWEAKSAYLTSYGKSGPAAPDPVALRGALKSAEILQKGSQNSPGAARRVLVLRALLHLPLLGPGKNGLDPAEAFAPAALSSLSPAEAQRYTDEGRLWADVAKGPHLSPTQTAAAAAVLRQTPNIRWWLGPSLSVLYQSQGNPRLAKHFAENARSQALATLGPLLLLTLIWFGLGLLGVGLLLALLARKLETRSLPPNTSQSPGFWPTLRETVPLPERRLRAGDLLGVFVLYLLMPNVIGWLLGGFSLHHGRFHLSVHGLIQPYRAHLAALSASDRAAALIVIEFFAYLLGAAVPVGVLLAIARKKRASITEELGFNTHRLGWNLLYGVGGYAIALPLLFLGQSVGAHIPGPTPSNPAIPLMANAGTVWVQLLLAGLATLAAPLCEEFLFRGVFYNAAKLKVGVWPAIVLTGLIFGFVHPVGIAAMLPLAVLGGVFAWMAETRKSLVPGMVGHFLQNSMATLMLLLALGS